MLLEKYERSSLKDRVLDFDCREKRKLSSELRKSMSHLVLAAVKYAIFKGSGNDHLPEPSAVAYGLRIAGEFAEKSDHVLSVISQIGNEYNRLAPRGDQLSAVYIANGLDSNKKPLEVKLEMR